MIALDIMILIWYHYNMRLINRDVDYSVRALIYIAAKAPEVVPVSGMEIKTGVSRPFLIKILQKLNKAGVLRSRKGRSGGFVLAKRPDKIFLSELISVFQGSTVQDGCVFNGLLCSSHRTCRLRRSLGAVEGKMLAEIEKISLKSLMA